MSDGAADYPRSRDSQAAELIRFGDAVKSLREAAGLRQEDLAARMGVNRVSISQIERGRREVGVTWIRPLAAALGVPAGRLFDAADLVENPRVPAAG